MSQRSKVAVIFGGRSSEHSISCISAGSVLRAIDSDRYEVTAIGITQSGKWVLHSGNPDELKVVDGVFPVVAESSDTILFTPDPTSGPLVWNDVVTELARMDVVFPVLHGPWGEDGTIQGLFELANVPYVGSGVFASAAAMDKAHMKALFSAAGLEVGAYEVITALQWQSNQDEALSRIANLGLPLFVKPARAGSSVGITKVKNYSDLLAAIEVAQQHDPKVIVEASLEQVREIECGVMSYADGPRASVIAEIIIHGDHEFYDFAAKYVDDSAQLCVPAEIDSDLVTRIQEVACRAFLALDTEGLARVDMFLQGERIVLNEINTMPGFTPISMFPRTWAATGIEYPELVDHLIQDALRRGVGLR